MLRGCSEIVVEVCLHVDVEEEMLSKAYVVSILHAYICTLGLGAGWVKRTPTLYRLMTLITHASRWKIFLFPMRIRASCRRVRVSPPV